MGALCMGKYVRGRRSLALARNNANQDRTQNPILSEDTLPTSCFRSARALRKHMDAKIPVALVPPYRTHAPWSPYEADLQNLDTQKKYPMKTLTPKQGLGCVFPYSCGPSPSGRRKFGWATSTTCSPLFLVVPRTHRPLGNRLRRRSRTRHPGDRR